jgi:hypothetical protein
MRREDPSRELPSLTLFLFSSQPASPNRLAAASKTLRSPSIRRVLLTLLCLSRLTRYFICCLHLPSLAHLSTFSFPTFPSFSLFSHLTFHSPLFPTISTSSRTFLWWDRTIARARYPLAHRQYIQSSDRHEKKLIKSTSSRES